MFLSAETCRLEVCCFLAGDGVGSEVSAQRQALV
jgi:hypothetical protein